MAGNLNSVLHTARRLAGDRSAATAIEYALIAGFLGLAIIATVPGVGETVAEFFESVSDGFQGEEQ